MSIHVRAALPLALLLTACAGEGDPLLTREADSDGGTWHVAMTATESVVAAVELAYELEITTAEGDPAPGLSVEVEPWMTSMNHGIMGTPTLEELGDGLYETTFAFSMAGAWDVRVHLTEGETTETATLAWDVE